MMPPTSAHFPHLATDFIMAVVEPSEWACLSYLLRHTYGFTGQAREEDKHKLIPLDQLAHGRADAEGRLLDLGVGLGRESIKKALEDLADKQLVVSRLLCLKCGWTQKEGDPVPPPAKKMKSPACPVCQRKLWPGYGIPLLTSKVLEAILNRVDPQHRRYTWNGPAGTYLVEVPAEESRRQQQEADLEAEAERLRNLLWYPELVDQCIRLAEGALKAGGKIATSRKVSGFYKPVLELQEKYVSSPLVKYALEETIKQKVPAGKRSSRWWRYPLTICENNKTNRRFAGTPVDSDTNAVKQAIESPEARQGAVRDLLRRAADLNGRGEYEPARALLSDLLADDNVKAVLPLFGDDRSFAECSVREAFKQGVSDFVGVDPTDSLGLDFYEEWSWPEDVATAKQRRSAARVSA